MASFAACLFRWTETACLCMGAVIACHWAGTVHVVAASAQQAQQAPQAPPPTTLPLRLVGIVVDPTTPSNAACLVECLFPERKLARVKAGQLACDLAEINEIRSDAVGITNVLTNRVELLTFSDVAPAAGAAPAPPPPVVTTTDDTVAVALAKGSVDYYLGNLRDFLDAASAVPKLRDGPNGPEIEGFEVTKVKQSGLVEQLGLQSGDVILAVDGQPLDGLPTVIRLMGQLQGTSQVKMTVVRKGQKLTFVLNSR
ncbi:MAG: PDZ domain-containing protein [Bacteroidales bacterium]